ncbi:ribosomal protein S18-alanine N-acetyltransferase [Mameliella alba]|nr:ribosomal protein S18-alanine N-acetyltransferase [Antarctobacter heliothermus]MBY6144984.1 ribosomal protein S18-alanine N-acetyltransferase [Mameliella alba]MCA0955938.1 ribosomal protein S18-alanine N-acetyltransferase [Mameliella alba]
MTPDTLAEIAARAYRHMTPWTAAQFQATLSRPHALLTTCEHAFVLGTVIVDEAEILALAADPAFQRQGQASRALDSFHRQARAGGATRVFLEVAARNAPARAFYARHGYAETGLRKGYYARPDGPADDAVIMARTLS